MDPNATLILILRKAMVIQTTESTDDELTAAEELSDAVLALHDWLSKGGALPQNWAEKR